jgi:peptidoglycan/xylan/chitin deacetylase (PgdA/CDA1 family)
MAAWWHIQHPGAIVAAQDPVPAVSPRALARVPRIARFVGGIPILTYHGISTRGGRYTVTPSEFSLQIAALARAGFQSITLDQLVASLHGRPAALAPRPIVLTFDDGAKTVWTRADPVLRRYGFRGVVFVITGRVGTHQPYYLTWDEIAAMRASRRWEFGSHTRAGHQFVLTGPARTGAFMTNRLWLGGRGLEPVAAYRTRITSDLDGSIGDLVRHGLPRPLVFADPFSASAAAANDRRLLGIALGIERSRFAVLVNNLQPVRLATRSALAGYERRIEVFRGTSPEGLVTAIERAIAATPGVLPAGRRGWKDRSRGHISRPTQSRRPARFHVEPPLRPEDIAPTVLTSVIRVLFPDLEDEVPELGLRPNAPANSPPTGSGRASGRAQPGGGRRRPGDGLRRRGSPQPVLLGSAAGGGGGNSSGASGTGQAAPSPGVPTDGASGLSPADTNQPPPTDTTSSSPPPVDPNATPTDPNATSPLDQISTPFPADQPPTDTTATGPPPPPSPGGP